MSRPFVPLHVHTQYSLLDGTTRIPDLVAWAQANNAPAAAITDHGVMYGAVEFYNAAKAAGIKPIIGCELYVVDGDITDRNSRKPYHHLVLLAKSHKGYQNLVKLVSIGQLEGFYYKPRVNWELIEAHSEDLVALTACLNGPVAHPVMRGNMEEGRDRARRLKAVFGEDVYLEIMDHGQDMEARFSAEACRIAAEVGMELVITNDSHFTRPEDLRMHEMILCLQAGKTLNDPNRVNPYGPAYCLKNGDEMAQLFRHLDPATVSRALDNTLVIADKCDLVLPMGQSILPDYPLEPGQTLEGYLRQVVYEHAEKRYGELNTDVTDRLEFELNIINQMGFPAYFLIVWDFINYARLNGIPVGPGRGSAAGSLVAFVLGITNIDPLEHNLLFERFLNPERISMPDIDIDFCIERREQVIEYVANRYGRDRVCQIATFGTFAARAALKAVGRVLDKPFAESDKIAKLIPATPGTKIKDALAEGQPLQKLYDSDPEIKEWVDLALSIEGTANTTGMHAAGVVISKDPLTQVVPLQNAKDGQVISQYPMGDLEKLGLLKMDFLGLRNLTIIDNTLNLIKDSGETPPDMDKLPLDDGPVFSMLTQAQTDGVFQLESSGMKALVKDLKPNVFEDINALVALFRPGPLNSGMVKQFVDRKHGREEVVYKHPDLEPILKDTYGTIVYQEQIMQIAQTLAGYSLGQADLLRRAMGKKKADVMAKEKDGFVQGALAHGVEETLANELFDTMTEFAAYCFNRSHSAAYALVAYQTAYLKAHFPVEYLSALLSSVRNDLDKIQHYILTGRRMGIQVLPPDVTKSGLNFTPDGQAIRFGLASIKNVGVGVVEAIIKARDEKPFASLEDFLERIDPKVMNRKTLESLIQCGAFSAFGVSRKQLFHNVDNLLRFSDKAQEQAETGQVSLFAALGGGGGGAGGGGGFGGLILSGDPGEYSDEQLQQSEKELLGFYVSSHPLDNLIETLPLLISHTIGELKETSDDTEVLIGGLVSNMVQKLTKTNKPIKIGVIEDFTGPVEIVAFSDAITAAAELLTEGRKILVKGRLQFRGDEQYSVVVKEVRPIEQTRPLNLFFEQVPRFEDVAYLRSVLSQHPGDCPVILNFPDGTRVKAGSRFTVQGDAAGLVDTLTRQLNVRCG
jgi:DNA polymerase-3 subunit alpha